MQSRAPDHDRPRPAGRRPCACRGAAPLRHAAGAGRPPDADRPRAGDALYRHAARADPRRLHVRPGAYRPGAARRQRRRAADPGGGDRDRPGGAPRRGDRPARRAVRPAVDRCRRRAGDAAGGGLPVKPIGQFLARLVGAGGGHCGPARASLWSVAAPAARNWRLRLARRYRERVRIVLVCDAAGAAGGRSVLCASRRPRPRWSMPGWNWPAAFGPAPGPTAGWRCPTAAFWRSQPRSGRPAWWDRRSSPPRASPATRPAACGWMRRCAASATASSSPPATARRSRAIARPKAGVWAVRAGAPLAANLRRAARGQTLRRWRPQSDALAILGLGDGRALAWRNGDRGLRRRGVALEGLDRSALDAHVPGADGANAGR